MKRESHILILAAMAIVLTGCNKWDCNGDLDGMWQLTEWRDKDNVVKATKEDMIFYSFQLKMANFRKKSSNEIFASINTKLEVSPNQIRIYEPSEYGGDGHDVLKSLSILASFGVPEDGLFQIQVLTGSNMQLKTSSEEILTFRKY